MPGDTLKLVCAPGVGQNSGHLSMHRRMRASAMYLWEIVTKMIAL